MPAFNAEKWVPQTIESIIAQTLCDWELIAINDGSNDNTPIILNSYALKDSRIKVIHQENKGVSASRQCGVNEANGEYIIHIDSDDWIEPNMLEVLYKRAVEKTADIVWCDLYINDQSKWSMSCDEDADIMIRHILMQNIWGSLCNKLILASICKKCSFPPTCSMWEDMAFVVQCLTYSKCISYVPKPLYHYRQVESSLVHTQSHKDISAEYRKAIDHIERFLASVGKLDKYKLEIRSLQLFAIRDFIDDKRFADYDKFLNTYPDAINHISEYDYPNRLKISAWLLQHGLGFGVGVPFVCKVDAGFRRLGLSKQM